MVPMQILSLKQYVDDYRKDRKTDTFLYHFQLNKIKRTTVSLKTETVCRHLTAVLKKSNAPRKQYYTNQGPF